MISAAIALSPPLEAATVIAGALWMTLAPQVPAFLRRRGLLSLITWPASRALLLALAHAGPGPMAVSLAADLVAWRALADLDGDGGEAAWAWASTPAVALFMLRAGAAGATGGAAAALALAFLARGWALPAGFALGAGVAVAGPWSAVVALPLALASWRHPVRVAAILVPVLGALTLWWGHANDASWPAHLDVPVAGVGPTLWRPFAACGLAVPATVAWAVASVAAGIGAVLLVRRGAEVASFGAWMFAVLASLAPGTSPAHMVAWLPFLCAWCANDDDRRGWWVIEGIALPLALLLEARALDGQCGPLWRGMAIAGIAGCAVLSLWPLRDLRSVRPPAPAPPTRRAPATRLGTH